MLNLVVVVAFHPVASPAQCYETYDDFDQLAEESGDDGSNLNQVLKVCSDQQSIGRIQWWESFAKDIHHSSC